MNNRTSLAQRPMSTHAGFTLVELVVAMVIAAILAAIAIPGYSNYVRKAHRTEAKSALLDLASLEERFFSTNNSYTATPTQLGYTGTATPFAVGTSGYYQITALTVVGATAPTTAIPGGTPATYTITATAVSTSDQFKDTSCRTFTVTSAGVQTSADSAGNPSTGCW